MTGFLRHGAALKMFALAVLVGVLIAAPHVARAQGFYDALLKTLHPVDRQAFGQAEAQGRAILEALRAVGLQGERNKDLSDMFALMDAARISAGRDQDLLGDCRIRSLQADRLGAYGYPFFKCRIFPEARAILLRKESGSQRIFGHLGREGDTRFLFAGSAYIYDEPGVPYSGFEDNPSQARRKGDVVGHLYRLAPRRYLLMLVPKNGRFEIFEIRK